MGFKCDLNFDIRFNYLCDEIQLEANYNPPVIQHDSSISIEENVKEAEINQLPISEHPISHDLSAVQIQNSLIEATRTFKELSDKELATINEYQGTVLASAHFDPTLFMALMSSMQNVKLSQESATTKRELLQDDELAYLVYIKLVAAGSVIPENMAQALSPEQIDSGLENYFLDMMPELIKNMRKLSPQHLTNLCLAHQEQKNQEATAEVQNHLDN